MKLSTPVQHYQKDAQEFDYFAADSGADRDTTRRLHEAVVNSLRDIRGTVILDLGSGNGWLQSALATRGATVVSLDAGLVNLRKIKERHSSSSLLVCADAARLPFRAGIFDGIVASEILEHLNHPSAVVQQCKELLRPDGVLTISTPYAETIKRYLCIHCNQPTPANAHLHSFDESSHSQMFQSAGFVNIRHIKILDRVFVASRLSYILRVLPYGVWRSIDRFVSALFRRETMIVVNATRSKDEQH